MSSAFEILYRVSSVGLRSPRSMAERCVLPISASPLKTSCDIPFFASEIRYNLADDFCVKCRCKHSIISHHHKCMRYLTP